MKIDVRHCATPTASQALDEGGSPGLMRGNLALGDDDCDNRADEADALCTDNNMFVHVTFISGT